MNTPIPFWPCPHNCLNWARATDLKAVTNHHPNCEHYNASLIDVWKVTDGSSSFYTEDEEAARYEADCYDDIKISKVKMHSEVYDALPEFDGF